MSTLGDIMSASGDIISTSGDVQYIGVDIMSTSGDVQYIRVFNRNWMDFINLLPHMHHDIPRCAEHPPMYSWYPLIYSWCPPNVKNIPRCTHGIPHIHHDVSPMYSWYPPDVLMVSADVLNTHHTGCPHDMKRVTISLFILPHPRKTWIYTTGLENNMSKLVVKSQLLTMEIINRWVSSCYIFCVHHLSRQILLWQKDHKSHRKLDCMFSKENGILNDWM